MDENEIKSNVERLELYSDNYPFNLTLRIQTFEGEGEYNKFIKNCEKLIRGCLEYKLWRNYITDVLQIQSCAITEENMSEVGVEVHHHIPTLFLLVKSLVNEKLEKEEPFCSFDITMKAIELHYSNKIGFVILISSIHEKVSNGFLNIPINLVKGDYNYFLRNYSKYLDEEDLETINIKTSIENSDILWSRDNYPGVINNG